MKQSMEVLLLMVLGIFDGHGDLATSGISLPGCFCIFCKPPPFMLRDISAAVWMGLFLFSSEMFSCTENFLRDG